jgi:hypothetical protein
LLSVNKYSKFGGRHNVLFNDSSVKLNKQMEHLV